MPKTHLKRFYQEQEESLVSNLRQVPELSSASQNSHGRVRQDFPLLTNNNNNNNSTLNQFAEITLAAAASSQKIQPHEQLILAHYLLGRRGHSTPYADLTPSNSPSPPPAHVSPTSLSVLRMKQPPLNNNNNYTRLDLLPPPQTAPEDLRVVARKIDFPEDEEEGTARTPADSTGEDESADSCSTSSILRNGCEAGHECPDCGKAYSTSSNLARHRQTHRSLEDKKARKCPHCEKTYVSMPAYSMHIRTHNQGCKCPFCGKCFSRPWLLQGHVRTHTGEKPFRCGICEKAFADKSNLRAHVQTHSNTKPFVCARCNKAFALKSYLYKHEESSCMRLIKSPMSKTRRKSSGTTVSNSTTPSPPPMLPNSPSVPSGSSAANAFGHHLLLALSKARAAFDATTNC